MNRHDVADQKVIAAQFIVFGRHPVLGSRGNQQPTLPNGTAAHQLSARWQAHFCLSAGRGPLVCPGRGANTPLPAIYKHNNSLKRTDCRTETIMDAVTPRTSSSNPPL